MDRLSGKRAIVTGATSGIGEGIARLFASERAHVALAGRRTQLGQRVAGEIRDAGGRAFFVQADDTDSNSVEELVRGAASKMGGIDILVNDAGNPVQGRMESLTEDDWDMAMDTNAKGVFLCSKAAIPHMVREKGGCIVNIGSVGGLKGYPGGSAYAPSKAAVAMLTRIMAIEYGKDGVRANCIAPGSIETPAWGSRVTGDIRNQIAKLVPLGRIGKPEDVAELALFLASDESSYITGTVIVIDGGQSAS